MANTHCVYCHLNKVNGKMYIGKASNTQKRWAPSGYRHCQKMYNAIQKYGWDNFEHIIIVDGLSQEQADLIEIELIKKYDTIQNGYNIRSGGRHYEISEETKQKLRAFNLSAKNPNAKKVICLQTGTIYYSPRQASEAMGLKDPTSIRQACLGVVERARGYHWRYLEEYEIQQEREGGES